jgi:hypothetical protein
MNPHSCDSDELLADQDCTAHRLIPDFVIVAGSGVHSAHGMEMRIQI